MKGANPVDLPSCAVGGPERCSVCSGVFASLTDSERSELDRVRKHCVFGSREYVFSQGDPATRIYSISEGVVRIFKLLPDGRRQVVGFALPGDFLGMALQDHQSLSAEAIGSASACSFPRVAFRRLVDGNLSVLRRMNQIASQELAAAHERMMILGRYTAEEKMAAFILTWRERLSRRVAAPKVVPLPMSRRDIADYLGLTIETVSRTFTKLERGKIIAVVAGGVRVVDEERAAQLAAASPPKA